MEPSNGFIRVECQLTAGYMLVLYTDGVTESFDKSGEEFGEQRLLAILRQNAKLSIQQILASVVERIQAFSAVEQHDDIILMVARRTGDLKVEGFDPFKSP